MGRLANDDMRVPKRLLQKLLLAMERSTIIPGCYEVGPAFAVAEREFEDAKAELKELLSYERNNPETSPHDEGSLSEGL